MTESLLIYLSIFSHIFLFLLQHLNNLSFDKNQNGKAFCHKVGTIDDLKRCCITPPIHSINIPLPYFLEILIQRWILLPDPLVWALLVIILASRMLWIWLHSYSKSSSQESLNYLSLVAKFNIHPTGWRGRPHKATMTHSSLTINA